MPLGFKLSLVFACMSFSCVSSRMSDRLSTQLFEDQDYTTSHERLFEGLKSQGETGKDRLLYLLDLGIVSHTAGLYEESNRFFLEADSLADIKDYTSLSEEVGSTFLSDQIRDYKGEEFEKVLINVYLAMNYALMDDIENALVEARRVNHKLERLNKEAKRSYELSTFARFLSGILYEVDQNWNDAYIDYQKVFKTRPDLNGLQGLLKEMALRLDLYEDAKQWVSDFKLVPKTKAKADGELIVFFENGLAPRKWPHPDFQEIPIFVPRNNPVSNAQVIVSQNSLESLSGETQVLDDIESMAIANLEQKYSSIIARKVAGLALKGVVSHAVGQTTNDPLLGFVTFLVLRATDQADLRSWELLPKNLQIFRTKLATGYYDVRLNLTGSARELPIKKVQISDGKKSFIHFRYTPRSLRSL